MARRVLCIDTELSCWSDSAYQKQQVLEVFEYGMALVDLEKMKVIRTGRYFVKNERHEVSRFCTELTRITQSTLSRQGLSLEHVARLLRDKWGARNKDVPIIAWGDERKWVEADCILKGVSYPFHNGLINLAQYYRFGEIGATRNISLLEACHVNEAEVVQPLHSAMEDAETLANLVIKLVENGLMWPQLGSAHPQ